MNALSLVIVGNLTSDPELRYTPSGAAVCRFTVAHTPRRLDRATGQWTDGEPTYLDCTAWRHLAEHLAESLTRGARVIVAGTLSTERWPDKDNAERTHSRMVLAVDAAGPELTYATARVAKMARRQGGQGGPAGDEWSTATATRPVSPAPTGTA